MRRPLPPLRPAGEPEPLPLGRIVGLIGLLSVASWCAVVGAWVLLSWVADTLIPTSVWIMASLLAVAGMLPA